eukprot:2504757-Pyramimonas_sp.AAC.1
MHSSCSRSALGPAGILARPGLVADSRTRPSARADVCLCVCVVVCEQHAAARAREELQDDQLPGAAVPRAEGVLPPPADPDGGSAAECGAGHVPRGERGDAGRQPGLRR